MKKRFPLAAVPSLTCSFLGTKTRANQKTSWELLPLFLSASILAAPLANGAEPAPVLVFNATTPTNDLKGSLEAQVLLGQSQIIPARPQAGDRQPRLVSLRKTLLLVRPLNADSVTPLSVVVYGADNKPLGIRSLNRPSRLPKTAYYIEGAPEGGIDFPPPSGGAKVSIQDAAQVEKLGDPVGGHLQSVLKQYAEVQIETADGVWTKNLYLPPGKAMDGKVIQIHSSAGYPSLVHYGERTVTLSTGQNLRFKCANGQWFRQGDLDNNGITYAKDAWSIVLPANWIVPGMSLQIRQGDLTGEISDLPVGAPSELLIHTIDVGMLVPPRGAFAFAKDPSAHREYFQTVPTSRLIVSQYAPIWLLEVMLPNGTLLTNVDPSEGGWHTGTMRQSIGKELISLGINNANYGINSTPGTGEGNHPYLVAQLTAHNSRGRYSNGIRVHGGSGGGGIVTLDESLGNEFSHEVGHNYGLGHYVDGFKGSVHRSAGQINSTWGWDGDKNTFIPNFDQVPTGKPSTLDAQSQAPFFGHSFGFDAMAGGYSFSNFNRFTLYTPNSAALIQSFLESRAVFDAKSPTGFSKWNASTLRMEPFNNRIRVGSESEASIGDLSETSLTESLASVDRVIISMADGKWNPNIPLPKASAANKGRTVSINHMAAYSSALYINGRQISVKKGFTKSYMSDGQQWHEAEFRQNFVERKPRFFGVPVVTLVGFYDPAGKLQSYIYPALHGAYGFCYPDDTKRLKGTDCHLLIETQTGVLRYQLENQRIDANNMNKFHVNVPEGSLPRRVSLMCGGQVIAEKTITPVNEKLSVTVNGVPIP